ncbi:hypothetical protein HZP95_08590 [Elizabethkingia anophelis]|nr:hypothetical protein [Elizabethkingia anophelis]MCT4101709.1 hypothetical protein [Elizabethkingia anophelis]MCT4166029.1 hypothetical protein [Elizabethkingia anophelis]HAY3540799.1 hypothetical protein [Elizabethkingia anophelis]
MKAKVNYNAIDTWLEPYIGHEFEVVKVTRNLVYFKIDRGYSICTEKHDKSNFNYELQ